MFLDARQQRARHTAAAPLGRDPQRDSPGPVRRREQTAAAGDRDGLDLAAAVLDEESESRRVGQRRPHRAGGRWGYPAARVGEAVLEFDGPLKIRILADAHAQL